MTAPSMNGKAHQAPAEPRFQIDAPPASAEPEPPRLVYSLRVRRVEKGENLYVRMLSQSVRGMITHFYQKRSYYCPGVTCKCPTHNNPQSFVWKGYVAAECWDEVQKLWMPVVLEITERLEQDFRHRYKRGQVWNLFRYAQKKSGEPVMGTLHETLDERTLPPAFEILPVLRSMYHWNSAMPLDATNPLPDRVLVAPTAGQAPKALEPTPASEEAAAEFESFTAEYDRQRKAFAEKRRKGKP